MLLDDFETRSEANLKKVGTDRYVRHPSTEPLCCAFKLGDQEWIWLHPLYNTRNVWPQWLLDALADPELLVAAHNAAFDRGIWAIAVKRFQFPPLPFERWYCTSAMARVNGLPAALDDGARAISSDMRKTAAGRGLIQKCCVPPYSESLDDLWPLAGYCRQDLRVQAKLMEHCRPLTQDEHQDWLVNERINQRGVRVDRFLAEHGTYYANDEAEAIKAELIRCTEEPDGFRIDSFSQHQRIKDWLLGYLPDEALPVLEVYKGGEKKLSTDKAVRQELLGRADEFDLDANTRYVLELINDGNRSSVSKFQKMLDMTTDEDERARGVFVYAGAPSTLRYAARGLQLHNMIRNCFSNEEAEAVLGQMVQDAPLDDVMETLARMLRPALIPDDGNVFVVGDWSAIEARALAWLAGDEKKLDIFRRGEDIYEAAAEAMGPDFDRQTGKVAELSLGYGGALGALNAMGRNYGVFLPERTGRRVVTAWRNANKKTVDYWYRLEGEAIAAVHQPGTEHSAGRITYQFDPSKETLYCFLPGATLMYPQCRLDDDGLTALKASWTPKADAREWPRIRLWHGVLAENVTQAVCAAILRWALRELDALGEEIVMHTHDELVDEVAKHRAAEALRHVTRIMNAECPHTPGLPLQAEPKVMTRYGK